MLFSFITYTLLVVAAGLFFGKSQSFSSEAYFLANRSVRSWMVALSSAASAESSWALMGLSGSAFVLGYQCLWLVPGCVAGYLFNFFVVAPRLRRRTKKNSQITLPDFLSGSFRNSSSIRWVSSIIILVTMVTYVTAQLVASGKAMDAVFSLDYSQGVLIGIVLVLAYVLTGGFKASVITDVIQGSTMFLSMLILPVFLLVKVGGFRELHEGLGVMDPALNSIFSNDYSLKVLLMIIGWLSIALAYPGLPHQLVRFMSIDRPEKLNQAGIIAASWAGVLFTGSILLGLIGRYIYGTVNDAEQILPLLAQEYLNPTISGFVIAAIFAAISSTADSQLVSGTSSLSHDILFKVFGINYKYQHLISLVILGFIATVFALKESRVIFDLVLYAWSGLGASFGPAILFTLFSKTTTKSGVLAGIIAGFTITVIWKEAGLSSYLYEIVPAIIGSTIIIFLINKISTEKLNYENN